MTEREKLIHNERIKALASFYNSLAAGAIVGGGFITSWHAFITPSVPGELWHGLSVNLAILVAEVTAMVTGIAIHAFANKMLGNLVD